MSDTETLEQPDEAAPEPDEALTASADSWAPPISWFRNPKLTGPTPHTVLDDGRVFGHLALWKSQHSGFPGQNVRPPKSRSDYSYFHVGSSEVTGDDGARTRVPVGHLTCDTGHAGLEASARDTKAFYDNTGTLAASVCVGEDEHGIWYAGAVDPELPELTRRRFAGCALSGDWRAVDGKGLELLAALSVPTPGFPIPRARVASGAPTADSDSPLALVAAGALLPRDFDPKEIIVTVTPDTKPAPETVEPEAVTAAAAAPTFTKDQVVNVLADRPIGMVASIDGGTATVTLEVPVEQLVDAGPEGRMALSASAQQRLLDSRAAAFDERMKASMERLEGLVASAEAKQRGAEALDVFSGVDAGSAEGNA